MRCLLVVVLAFLSQCGGANAWGDEGHKIIGEIAFRLAQPDTRSALRKLIRSDTKFDTFSESCVFPDHSRKRASEHFINLARDSQGLSSDECPQADKCGLSAIRNDSKILWVKICQKSRQIARAEISRSLGGRHPSTAARFVRGRSWG